MRKRDLFRMGDGEFQLTDSIDNYHYTLRIGLNNDGSRFYRITEKGSLSRQSIFMVECYEKDEDGFKYKALTAIAGIGGLSLHTNNTFSMLDELRLLPRGSFTQFVEHTNIQ